MCLLDGCLLVHCPEVWSRLTERICVVLLPDANHCSSQELTRRSQNLSSMHCMKHRNRLSHTFSGTFRIQGPRRTEHFFLWRMLEGCTLYLHGPSRFSSSSYLARLQRKAKGSQLRTWPGSRCCSNTLVFIDGRWVPYHRSSAGTLALCRTVMASCSYENTSCANQPRSLDNSDNSPLEKRHHAIGSAGLV